MLYETVARAKEVIGVNPEPCMGTPAPPGCRPGYSGTNPRTGVRHPPPPRAGRGRQLPGGACPHAGARLPYGQAWALPDEHISLRGPGPARICTRTPPGHDRSGEQDASPRWRPPVDRLRRAGQCRPARAKPFSEESPSPVPRSRRCRGLPSWRRGGYGGWPALGGGCRGARGVSAGRRASGRSPGCGASRGRRAR